MSKGKRSASSQRWRQRQSRDPFVKQSRADGYRSRAVYKLIEIDQKDRLFTPGMTVLDLGAAPGSWSQYAKQQIGAQGLVIAVDLLPVRANDVVSIQCDIDDLKILPIIHEYQRLNVDLVISDIAPNMSGIQLIDQARSLNLLESALRICDQVLKSEGTLLAKTFEGESANEFRKMCKQRFKQIFIRKPRSSRSESREIYVLARGFKPNRNAIF